MPDPNGSKAVPGSTLAVASLLVGLLVARGGQSDPPKADITGSPASSPLDGLAGLPTAPVNVSIDSTDVLRPLSEVLFGEGPKKDTKGLAEIQVKLKGSLPISVDCLTAMVPDPVETSLSFRFDETIDSIERALGTRDYLLKRWRLPWAEPMEPDHSGVDLVADREKAVLHVDAARPSTRSPGGLKAHPTPGDPGLLIFRRASKWKGKKEDEPPHLILVFLVAETPTQGLDRKALTLGLEISEELRGSSAGRYKQGRAAQILGPVFSGSMPSLRDTLADWLRAKPGRSTDINVISGTATAFDKEGFEGYFKDPRLALPTGIEVKFSATVHQTRTVQDTILKFLNRRTDDSDVAILSEINTGFGESITETTTGTQLKYHRLSLQYPLHIAEIRKRYESQGLFQDVSSDIFKSAGELRGPGSSTARARDVFPDQTSEATTVAEARVLTQTLRYLEDSRFKYIGIISTDPHDTVFLARLIGRYCPDARVFTASADLLYLDPLSISDLRGMIVGSTYPLYAPNHSWSGSDESSRGHVFPSEYAQGLFNATLIEANRLLGREARDGLLEYAMPRSLQADQVAHGQPPVWISVVGERSLYPVDCQWAGSSDVDPSKESNYLAKVGPPPVAADFGPKTLKINRVSAWMVCFGGISLLIVATQVNRIWMAREGLTGSELREPFTPTISWLFEVLTSGSILVVRGLIFVGYLFIASPFLAACPVLAGRSEVVDLNLDKVPINWLFFDGMIAVFCLVPASLLVSPIVEFARKRRSIGGVVAEVFLLMALLGAALGLIWNRPGLASWPLSLDRATSLTGGVSPFVPAFFLMIALGAWIHARNRIREVNRDLGLPLSINDPSVAEGPPPSMGAVGGYDVVLAEIRCHRDSFESWFGEHHGRAIRHLREFLAREPWKASWTWLAVIVLMAATLIDAIWFRQLSRSDEGLLFDVIFRFTFGVVFFLFCMLFALLASAWHDLRAVLDGFSKILNGAFNRIPKKLSVWFFNPVACEEDYHLLILRQIYAIRALLDQWPASPPRKGTKGLEAGFKDDEIRKHLDHLERWQTDRQSGHHHEVESIRHFARKLAVHWAAQPVGQAPHLPEKDDHRTRSEPSFDDQLISRLEELLALHATRWISGALGRIWILIGFLVVSSLSLLFAITSYPFPEQPRVMTILGLAIAGLLVMIVRVVVGTNRDEVISRVGDTKPGQITWDSSLYGHLGTFVVPLIGVLAAISFDVLDLFRAVLGPIFRLFP